MLAIILFVDRFVAPVNWDLLRDLNPEAGLVLFALFFLQGLFALGRQADSRRQ
jgi:hypothetical protein